MLASSDFTYTETGLGLSAGFFAIFAVFGAFALVLTALWVWSLVDALRIDDRHWDAAGQNKLLWVLVIVFLGLLGSILYVVIPRPDLSRISQWDPRSGPAPSRSPTRP